MATQWRGDAFVLARLLHRNPRFNRVRLRWSFIDRWNRKLMMILGDTVAGLSTIAILLLFLTNHLELWHLYLTGAINGLFGYLQGLAFSASVAMIVPKQQYTRVSAMGSIKIFGSGILAPALAAALHYIIGLADILAIDLAIFMIAVGMLMVVQIPQPKQSEAGQESDNHLWQKLTFGFRYIFRRPSLVALLVYDLIYIFLDNASNVLVPILCEDALK